MSHLLDYLHVHFPNGPTSEIVSHFNETFGVDIKIEDDFLLFKYNMIAVKWTSQVPFECRGHILTFKDGEWKFMSRPFDKFFNLSEGHCPLFGTDYVFKRYIPNLTLAEKKDGTCIQMWFDGKGWRISTLGCITTLNVGYTNLTFEQLFWMGVRNDLVHDLNEEYTYIFELTSPYNRIVTDYGDKIQVTLLSVRHNKTGNESRTIDDVFARVEDRDDIFPVQRFTLKSLKINSKDELVSFVEETSNNDSYGKNPEGWVVYHNTQPVAKVKNNKYLALHRFSGGDSLCSRNSLVELFLAGGIDDVYSDLIPTMKEFCDLMGEWLRNTYQEVSRICKEVKEKNPESQKDFALIVKGTPYSSFFFQNKDNILSGTITMDDFTDWIKTKTPSSIIETLKGLWNSVTMPTINN